MEILDLLESLEEGEETEELDLSSDIYEAKMDVVEVATKDGVLCTLQGVSMGPFGDVDSNRNKRVYPIEVARERIIDAPYTKEMLANRTLFGEPHHPKDRYEVYLDQVSHSIREITLNEDNCIELVIDVLDTPNGRILKTLIDYGCKLGVSARATGKTRKKDGKLWVVPETYTFKTFDMVTQPGFENARLQLVNEGVESPSLKTLVESVLESENKEELNSVKTLIEYSEDGEAKELLPEVEKKLEDVDKSASDEEGSETSDQSLKEEIDELNSELESVYVDLAEEKEKVEKLEEERAVLEEKVKSLDSVKEDSDGLKNDMVNVLRENEALAESFESLENENVFLREALSKSDEEIHHFKTQLEESERMVESLKDIIDEAENAISSLEDSNLRESVEEPVKQEKVSFKGAITKTKSVELTESVGETDMRLVGLIESIGGK